MSAVQQRQSSTSVSDEELAEQLSAFLDGEADEPDWLLSQQGRSQWATYHLIGDVLRTPDLASAPSSRFSRQLMQALQDEPTVLAPPRRPVTRWMRRYAVPGASLVVLVVAVSWLAQPLINPWGVSGGLQASITTQPAYAINTQRGDADFEDYYDVHRHVAGMSGATQGTYASAAEQ